MQSVGVDVSNRLCSTYLETRTDIHNNVVESHVFMRKILLGVCTYFPSPTVNSTWEIPRSAMDRFTKVSRSKTRNRVHIFYKAELVTIEADAKDDDQHHAITQRSIVITRCSVWYGVDLRIETKSMTDKSHLGSPAKLSIFGCCVP